MPQPSMDLGIPKKEKAKEKHRKFNILMKTFSFTVIFKSKHNSI